MGLSRPVNSLSLDIDSDMSTRGASIFYNKTTFSFTLRSQKLSPLYLLWCMEGKRRGSHRISLLHVKFHVVYFEFSGQLKIGLPFDH